ncbi:LOW QUALITY PROTEIN: COP9 signalosome complex subunit 7b [Arvicanthis niloticus]|nr:LOW QUALITY PROTEIN: COP9 signalosome complex subunit 7b [Arvicanthis niloticus]
MGLVSEFCYLKPSRKVLFYPGDMTAHRQLTSVYMELRSLQTMPQSRWEVAKAEREHCVGGTRVQQWEASGGTAPVTGRRRQKSAGRRADHGSLTTCRQALGGRDIGEEKRVGGDRSQDQRMAGEQKPSSNLLEQFILLAKGTSGSALTTLISQVLEAPGVYVFGELLELANVQELAEGANASYLQLLNLFAYGTYPDYLANKESLPALSAAQQNKLKHLTIVSLASRMKCIPYSVLLKDLEMRNLRELEDLIIEAVYTDIIQGKLDQRNQLLEVDFCIGRDIRKKDINNIVKTLHEWCDGCEAVLLGIEQQVLRANQYKENHHRTQQQVEAEVSNIKKTLKATASSSAQEMEQQLAERECPPHTEQRQPTKKMSKVKGLVSSRH